jgi:hypothetical protein
MAKVNRNEAVEIFRMAIRNGYTVDTGKHEGIVRLVYRNDEGDDKSLTMTEYSFLSLSAEAVEKVWRELSDEVCEESQ